MFNFGDDLVLEVSDRVPWLLLLNLLVMFLLIVVLYYSSIFVSDITNGSVEVELDPQLQTLESKSSYSNSCRVSSQHSKIKRWQSNEECTVLQKHEPINATRRIGQREVEEIQQGEKLSARDDSTQSTQSYDSYNPCHWLQLVSKVFLGCLGLHSNSQDSLPDKLRNNDHSDGRSKNSTGRKHHQL